jgi:hypothetical protein
MRLRHHLLPCLRLAASTLLLVAFSILSSAGIGLASPYPAPSILLHAQGVTAKNACGALNLPDCDGVNTAADLASLDVGPYYYVYLMGGRPFNYPGPISLMRCGITYQNNQVGDISDGQGVEIYSWNLCADLEFPHPVGAWPRAGSGNTFVWSQDNCQAGLFAVAGYFYVGAYSADILGVTGHPSIANNPSHLEDCMGYRTDVSFGHLGHVAFSAGASDYGCNGCLGDCPKLPLPPPAPGPLALSLHLADPPLSWNPTVACDSVDVTGLSSPAGDHYYAYLMASIGGVRGLASVAFGIDYQGGIPGGASDGAGIDILAWGEYGGGYITRDPTPDWPEPGSGLRVNFGGSCPAGPTIPVAYFYISAYSADVLSVTPHPTGSVAEVRDCLWNPVNVDMARLGRVAFSPDGSATGCRPCLQECDGPTVTQPTTWGAIKSLFQGR